MANPISKLRNLQSKVQEGINDFTSNDIFTSELNKVRRYKILLDRVTRPAKIGSKRYAMTPVDKKAISNTGVGGTQLAVRSSEEANLPSNNLYFQGGRSPIQNEVAKEEWKLTVIKNRKLVLKEDTENGTHINSIPQSIYTTRHQNSLEKNTHEIYIYNISSTPMQYIQLQSVPTQIEHQGESAWAIINSMGRNTPMYHFTGAESIIQFNISWFCNDPTNPQEVVTKCRLLEAWTKANGYLASPPILRIGWGSSDLFKDQNFILTSATYVLKDWRATAKLFDRDKGQWVQAVGPNTGKTYTQPGMYPASATQELVFRRVSATNLTYEDIVSTEWRNKTKGIGTTDTID